jgi:hypothetical protein
MTEQSTSGAEYRRRLDELTLRRCVRRKLEDPHGEPIGIDVVRSSGLAPGESASPRMMVPEKPVTTASPLPMIECCAAAEPQSNMQEASVGIAKALKWRRMYCLAVVGALSEAQPSAKSPLSSMTVS